MQVKKEYQGLAGLTTLNKYSRYRLQEYFKYWNSLVHWFTYIGLRCFQTYLMQFNIKLDPLNQLELDHMRKVDNGEQILRNTNDVFIMKLKNAGLE